MPKMKIRVVAPKRATKKPTTKANPSTKYKFAIFQFLNGDREFVGAFMHKDYAVAIANILNKQKAKGAEFFVASLPFKEKYGYTIK